VEVTAGRVGRVDHELHEATADAVPA
jgi:hypothetical protein